MEMAIEESANPCSDSRLLQYLVAALFVATETSGSKGLPTDVVD